MPAYIHTTEYGSPAPADGGAPSSPTSSIGSGRGHVPDQTSWSDSESTISQEKFEYKAMERIGLFNATLEEQEANRTPLLNYPPKGSTEEKGE